MTILPAKLIPPITVNTLAAFITENLGQPQHRHRRTFVVCYEIAEYPDFPMGNLLGPFIRLVGLINTAKIKPAVAIIAVTKKAV